MVAAVGTTAAAPAPFADTRAAIAEARRAADAVAVVDARVLPQPDLDAALSAHPGFALQAGDVLLLRGTDLISAAISQIGLAPADFSHMAIVGLDPLWDSLEIVEAGVADGVRIQLVEDWLQQSFVRFLVLRHEDAAVARAAAVAAYRDAQSRSGEARVYDFALALNDDRRLYCSELIRNAYARAAPAAAPVPIDAALSKVGGLRETYPLAPLGVRTDTVFLPDDLLLDARFRPVLELRHPTLLAESEALDIWFRTLFASLRGPARDDWVKTIDAQVPRGPLVIPYLLRDNLRTYLQIPEAARAPIAGMALLAEREAGRLASTAAPVGPKRKADTRVPVFRSLP